MEVICSPCILERPSEVELDAGPGHASAHDVDVRHDHDVTADHDNDATYPINDAVIGADNGWVDVTAEHYDARTGHLRG